MSGPAPSLAGQCAAVAGRGLQRYRCRRKGRFPHDGKVYCRTHARGLPRVEVDVYEGLTGPLCACGCGQPSNLWYAVFASHVHDGWTHRKIAEAYGFHRSFVTHTLNHPSKYVRGHNTAGYWLTQEGQDRKAEGMLLGNRGILSLDSRPTAIAGTSHAGLTRHEVIASDDPEQLAIQADLAERLRGVIGNMTEEDVQRLDAVSLSRLQDRLRDAGLATRAVMQSERDRLKTPEAHTGERITKAPLIPGRKTRRQRIAHKQMNRDGGNSNRPPQKPRKRWERSQS